MEAKPGGEYLERGEEPGMKLMAFEIYTVQPIICLQNSELTYWYTVIFNGKTYYCPETMH